MSKGEILIYYEYIYVINLLIIYQLKNLHDEYSKYVQRKRRF